MHARVSTVRAEPIGIDAAIREFSDVTLPQARELEGFKGATLLVNRENGLMKALTYWDSKELLEASTEVATNLRNAFVQKAYKAELVSVEAFEVTVDEYEA